MKRMRILTNVFTSRRLRVTATLAILCATPVATTQAKDLFYTTSGVGAEVFAISVSGGKIATTDIGPTNGGVCGSLALSPSSGKLYSMCGPLFGPGPQQLATIDPETGQANLFGVAVPGLAVMAMTFAPNGILYAVGDCNPDANFECTPNSDPNYNS